MNHPRRSARLVALQNSHAELLAALNKLAIFVNHRGKCSRWKGPKCNCGLSEIDDLVNAAIARAEALTRNAE